MLATGTVRVDVYCALLVDLYTVGFPYRQLGFCYVLIYRVCSPVAVLYIVVHKTKHYIICDE